MVESLWPIREAISQCRDERLPTTTTDDQISFFGPAERWRDTPRVALKDCKIIGGHGQAEDRLQNHQPGRPGIERLEPGQASKEPGASYRIDDVDCVRHETKKAC